MIKLSGVKTHNLKDLSLSLPLGRLICITGPSGSGKSSLAFDTIYAEARRRYLKVLSLTEKEISLPFFPSVLREASGLPPAVALEQKLPRLSPRSTVGSLTGILDFLRTLYAELGTRKCPACETLFEVYSPSQIIDELLPAEEGEKVYVLAPLWQPSEKAFSFLVAEGYQRFFIRNQVVDLTEEVLPADLSPAFVLVDRLILRKKDKSRLKEAFLLASSLSGGVISLYFLGTKKQISFSTGLRCPRCGKILEALGPEHFSYNHPAGACPSCEGLGEKEGKICPACEGDRLAPASRNVLLGGLTLPELSRKPLEETLTFLEKCAFKGIKQKIFEGLFLEIKARTEPILALGLGYLPLYHPAKALSLGELQRLRLSSLFGERLSGCLYIFDEPGLGLTPREKEKVLFLLQSLVNQGNTVLLVEHDPLFIKAADIVLELGPGAGEEGGELLFTGSAEELARHPELPTGGYLAGQKRLKRKKFLPKGELKVSEVRVPQGVLLVFCGVSGGGKSNFLRVLSRSPQAVMVEPAPPSGKESIVVSFIGAFKGLREFLAATKEARTLGFKSSHFSLFTPHGRCPLCKGKKKHLIDVKPLPPLEVPCEECLGTGFRREVLKVRYRGYNVAELLELTVAEALRLFAPHPEISKRLKLLAEVGLGYLRLGQELSTLSGGERQRLQLARFLLSAPKDKRILLFDTPSLGLHLGDVQLLLDLFDRLLGEGFTLVVAENHPGFVLLADELWEFEGGGVVWRGTPREWLKSPRPLATFYARYTSLVAFS